MSKLNDNIIDDYKKMQVLREVAKGWPNSHLEYILESLDRQWDEIIKGLQPPEKKKLFVTKF